jgi:hypothetical protein
MSGDDRTGEERLASRYWDLLDFYPARYREERGPELVGTLLDCARPGQTRPSWREARALVLEGLRVRAGTGGHRPARVTLAGGVQWGMLVLLVAALLERVTAVVARRGHEDIRPVTAGWSVLFALAVLAMVVPFVLLALGRVRAALPLVVVAGAVQMAGFPWLHRTGWADLAGLTGEGPGILPVHLSPGTATVLVAGTLLLIRLRPGPVGRTGVAAVMLAPVLVSAPGWLQDAGVLPDDVDVVLWPGLLLVFLLGYFGIIVYTVVDARPAVAATALLAVPVVDLMASALTWGIGVSAVTTVLVLVLPVGVAGWLGARRQARLPGPDAPA